LPRSAIGRDIAKSVFQVHGSYHSWDRLLCGGTTSTVSFCELGPGAIIIRSGNKLYIAEGQTLRGVVPAYAYDPRQYNPSLTGGGTVGYNQQFAYDPRQHNPSLTGGGSGSPGYNAMLMQFAYDPRQYNPSLTGGGSPGYNAMLMQFAYGPDYVQYKLKKAFEENWIPANTK
jgi:hypothetical protein